MNRVRVVFSLITLVFLAIWGRLFYWQIVKSDQLTALAEDQYLSSFSVPARRGEILANDGYPLVTNQPAFLAYIQKNQLEQSAKQVAQKIAPLVVQIPEGSESAKLLEKKLKQTTETLISRIQNPKTVWVPVARKLDQEQKQALEKLNISGLGFEETEKRLYPEASMSAHLLGFVGKDEQNQDQGYFGLEGFYNLDLSGRPGLKYEEKDALGKPIIWGDFYAVEPKAGSSLRLHLDRGIQFMVEQELKTAVERHQAESGSVVILNPKTGAVLSMASYPAYDPQDYGKYPDLYKNPVVAATYEPGSTFKPLVMAAALEAGAVARNDKCSDCDGPRQIGKYTITTWNQEYHPQASMDEVLLYSDNIGMIWVAERLGLEKTFEYVNKFGFGEETGIDLQEEARAILKPKSKWGQVGLATTSFGQGLAVTRIQMVRAIAALANQGKLMEPQVVSQVVDGQQAIEIKPKVVRQVVSPETAKIITDMMVNTVDKSALSKLNTKGYKIAGKTGTSQIPISGHYDENKTIASFVGFGPADEPAFVMLVTLKEPKSSPWGAVTAAPLFFKISNKLLFYLGIPPS